MIKWYPLAGFVLPALMLACQPKEQPSTQIQAPDSLAAPTAQNRAEAPVEIPAGQLRVAWVNMDSLLHSYDLYFEMEREMAALSGAAERELTAKGKELERRVVEFQDQVQKGLMTRSEAQKKQEDLAQEQQRFLQLQETKRQQLIEEEQVRLRKVQNAIAEYIQRFNAQHGYHYILNSATALHADPRLNITAQVLEALNAEYAETHRAQSDAKSPK